MVAHQSLADLFSLWHGLKPSEHVVGWLAVVHATIFGGTRYARAATAMTLRNWADLRFGWVDGGLK